ncbi:MAG: alcohol dehydrogenase catalytic domain-containing protein [Elusimicrobiota bacterium]
MLQAKVVEYNKIVVEDVPVPHAGKGEVVLKVIICGICGSDIHAFTGKHPFITPPIVPGHEMSGVIHELGDGVTGLKPGERVTIEPSIVCGTCPQCRAGRYNICDNLKVIGCQIDGAFAEYLRVPADRVVKIPDTMTHDQAVFIEPAAVAVHTVIRAGIENLAAPSACVLITGAGTIGLMVLQTAVAFGAREIVITDTIDSRLELAKKLGAKYGVNIKTVTLTNWMKDKYGIQNPVTLAFDCVGNEFSFDSCILTARKGARIVVVGVYPGKVPVNMSWVQDREFEIVGTLMYTRKDYVKAIELIDTGKIHNTELISKRVPLKDVASLYASIGKPSPNPGIKMLVDISTDLGK